MAEQAAITPLTSGAEHSLALSKSEGSSRACSARIAQLVEQRIENPRVGGSNPPPGTINCLKNLTNFGRFCVCGRSLILPCVSHYCPIKRSMIDSSLVALTTNDLEHSRTPEVRF